MDDGWRCVFEMLSTTDQIRCERVCQKWRNLLRERWRITTSIDTETACRGVHFHQWSLCIESIIDRCSDQIVTFKFGARTNSHKVFPTKVELSENIFEKILMKSSQLRVFQVTNSLVPLESLSMFECMPSTLQVFRLESCVIDVDKPEIVRHSLLQMFQRCSLLKEFTITGRGSCYGHLVIDDNLLNYVPASVEKLSISAGDSLKIRDAGFVRHLEKLLSFSAQRSFLSTRSLADIVSVRVGLVHLDLSFARQIIDFSPIARLTSLKNLILNGNRENLMDDHLSQIVAGCQRLEALSLENCTQLTEFGLLSIKECSQMKRLNLLGQCCITDLVIWSIVRGCNEIEELDITYCTRISKAGLCCVLQLPHLKHLQVSGVQEFDTRLARLLSDVLPQCKLVAENCKYSREREKGLQRKMKSLLPIETAVTAFFRLDD